MAETTHPASERDGSRADSFIRLIERSRRGKLKVYLGYGPGVGKTYRALLEARALAERGVDVVIGYVENHGREETQALTEGLEAVPRRQTAYRGMTLEEMDVDAVLERQPTAVLVDELAHTNVPGSRHRKRYEDVLELVEAGIHVITTVNVQHLESLYDTVEQLVGVKVKERLPDWVLEEADQVVNIDLSTEDLQQRMEAGKVYPEERAQAALKNFFQRSNLEHLRNLTLRETAGYIEGRGRSRAEQDRINAPDQVMVCLSSRGPDSAVLLRYASRLAGRLNRTWYALYVQKPSEGPTRVAAKTQRLLANTLTLADQLGATVSMFKGEDVVETILRFAEEYGVGHIVIGRSPSPPFWKRLFRRKTVVQRLIDQAEDKAIVVIDTRRASEAGSPLSPTGQRDPTGETAGDKTRRRDEHSGNASAALFSDLSAEQVVLWDAPVPEDEAREVLLKRALQADGTLDREEARRALHEHEDRQSTFLGEGIALMHARFAELVQPALALGLTRGGLTDGPGGADVEMIWLMLLPETPAPDLRPTARVAQLCKSKRGRRRLRQATTPEEVAAALQRWEAVSDPVATRA